MGTRQRPRALKGSVDGDGLALGLGGLGDTHGEHTVRHLGTDALGVHLLGEPHGAVEAAETALDVAQSILLLVAVLARLLFHAE